MLESISLGLGDLLKMINWASLIAFGGVILPRVIGPSRTLIIDNEPIEKLVETSH